MKGKVKRLFRPKGQVTDEDDPVCFYCAAAYEEQNDPIMGKFLDLPCRCNDPITIGDLEMAIAVIKKKEQK